MHFLGEVIACFIVFYFFVSIPITWLWILYYRIKCWQVRSCTDRTCKFWQYCNHNEVAKKIDCLNFRIETIARNLDLIEDNLNEKKKQ